MCETCHFYTRLNHFKVVLHYYFVKSTQNYFVYARIKITNNIRIFVANTITNNYLFLLMADNFMFTEYEPLFKMQFMHS